MFVLDLMVRPRILVCRKMLSATWADTITQEVGRNKTNRLNFIAQLVGVGWLTLTLILTRTLNPTYLTLNPSIYPKPNNPCPNSYRVIGPSTQSHFPCCGNFLHWSVQGRKLMESLRQKFQSSSSAEGRGRPMTAWPYAYWRSSTHKQKLLPSPSTSTTLSLSHFIHVVIILH
jgi:hypothetical protein